MSEDTIDDLIANFNKSPESSKKKPPRKGNNKARAGLKKPDKRVSALVQEGTLAYNAAEALKRGLTMHEIALEYDITEDRLKAVLTSAIEKIQSDAGPVLLNYIYMTISRYELILRSLFNNLEYPDGTTNLDVQKEIRGIMKEQREALEFAMSDNKGQNGSSFSVTFTSNSPLYNEGNRAIVDQKKLGDGIIVQREEEITHLDGVLNGIGIPRS